MYPVLLQLPFGLAVYSYGFMLAIGIIVGIHLTTQLAEEQGYRREWINSVLMWTVVGSIVGARGLDVWVNWDAKYAAGFPGSVFNYKNAGLVAYGGYLGGVFTALGMCLYKQVSFLRFADCAAATLSLGLGFTRIGCLLAGCDFGQPTDGPWGITFPKGSQAFGQHAREGLLADGATHSLAVHPTQIYESLFGFAFFGVLWVMYPRRKFDGHVLAAFFAGYAIFRFAIENIRGDGGRGAVGTFSTSQLIALVTGLLAIAVVVWGFTTNRKPASAPAMPPLTPAGGRRPKTA